MAFSLTGGNATSRPLEFVCECCNVLFEHCRDGKGVAKGAALKTCETNAFGHAARCCEDSDISHHLSECGILLCSWFRLERKRIWRRIGAASVVYL